MPCAGSSVSTERFPRLYERLLAAYGPQGWWPASDPFRVILGAILVQRVTWEGAARAIENLDRQGLCSPGAIAEAADARVEQCLVPAGFYRNKTRSLRAVADWLRQRFDGHLDRALSLPAERLRNELLSIHGIGPETADAILVYAAHRPSFVVDQSLRRLLDRLGWIRGDETYGEIQASLHRVLPADAALFNEAHALIVQHGKLHCRTRPLCAGCPVDDLCEFVARGRSTSSPHGETCGS